MKKFTIFLLLFTIQVSIFSVRYETSISQTIKHGTISIDSPIDIGNTGIEEIIFTYGINKIGTQTSFAEVFYSQKTYQKIENLVLQKLEKKNIPISEPVFNKLDDVTTDNNTIQLSMSNGNTISMFGNTSRYFGSGHLFTLKYTVVIPYSQPIYSSIQNVLNGKYDKDINKFQRTRKAFRISGISVFTAGMLSAVLLHIGAVVATFALAQGSIQREVPLSLLFTGFGTLGLSLTVGLPLWGISKVKKKYTIKFNK